MLKKIGAMVLSICVLSTPVVMADPKKPESSPPSKKLTPAEREAAEKAVHDQIESWEENAKRVEEAERAEGMPVLTL